MASITLLTTNTSGADSLTIINSNFTGINNSLPSATIVDISTVQTLTNKTLTAPTITSPSITGTIDGSPTITTPTITKPVMNATNPTAQTYTPSIAGTATLDLSLANQHFITMPAGNITIALSNDTNNQNFLISTTQDSGGSRTVTWFSGISWAGGTPPTLTTTASKTDIFGFIRTGAGAYWGLVVGQNI